MTDVNAAHESQVGAISSALDLLAPKKIMKTKQIKGFTLSLWADTMVTMKQRDSDSVSPSHPSSVLYVIKQENWSAAMLLLEP